MPNRARCAPQTRPLPVEKSGKKGHHDCGGVPSSRPACVPRHGTPLPHSWKGRAEWPKPSLVLVNPSLVLPVLSLVLGEPSLIRRDLGLIRSDLSLDPVILTLVWSDLSLDRADLSLVLCDLSLIRPKLSLVPVILTWDLAIPPAFVPFPFKAAAVPSRGQCGASGRSSCESSSAAQGQVRGAVAARF